MWYFFFDGRNGLQPLPTGLAVTRKKPAPPPPVPIPDYDLNPGREMDAVNQDTTDGVLRQNTPDQKPRPNGVRVSIGTYQELRPEPTKLDFLPKRHSTSPGGLKSSDGAIKNQLQTELNQTLSRARLRQRLPSCDLPLQEDETKNNQPSAVQVNIVRPAAISKEITIDRNRVPPSSTGVVLSTFGRIPSAEIQAKMASLAAASAALAGPAAREATISQSADNKVTIKVQPYVPSRSDFGQT